ncbi:MAG: DUF433 domain-containing protein, partial [Gammaproteobacteria bacterium]|nr:DUF433 domain-containing protein [Gammaproteobacteria bacterium]
MVDTQSSPSFTGIYDVPEAARYIRGALNAEVVYPVQSSKMIRWIRRGVASPDLADTPGRKLLIGFEDLISLRVVLALRAARVKWSRIDRAETWLRTNTGARRPFATEALWTGQGHVFARLREQLLSPSASGQLAFDILHDYLFPVHGLRFDDETRMANSWAPVAGVVLEPDVQFGSPCLKGTRIPTRTVAGMVEAGDSPEWVASAYRISREEVQAACDWE